MAETINSTLLAEKPVVTVPTITQTPVDQSIAQSAISGIAGQYESVNKQLEQAQAEQKAQAESQLSLQNTLLGKTQFSQEAQAQSGVNTETANLNKYAQQLADINAQASSLQREAQAIPIANRLDYQSKGITGTESQVKNVNYDQLQQNALKALSLGQQADIAAASLTGSQLRLQAAKDKAQQMVDLKYKPIEDQLAIKKQQYELNKDILSQIDKKRTEALTLSIQKEERDIAEKKANEKEINSMIVEATPNAPTSVIANAKKLAESGASKLAVAQALGIYGGDYLKNELLKAQIAKTKSEMIKVDTQTSNLRALPTGVVTAPNGDAIGIPNETLAAIGKLKLGEGQANAVAFVSRMIQASKAIDKQLGTISPTGGFYETSGYDPTSAGSSIGRLVGSDQSRTYNTNAQDFIRAKLRKESGAAIGKDEFDADAAIYTPAGAGLDEKDLLLAQTKRDEAIKSMIAQAGPAAPYLQQYYEQSKTQGDAFMSENPQLNSWYQNTAGAVQTSTAQATTGASSYGFTDNQTK